MNMTAVLHGQVTSVETDSDVLDYDFETDNATPFPLQAVLAKLYLEEVYSTDTAEECDAMELAVLFSNIFNDSISVNQVKQAQTAAERRFYKNGVPEQQILVQEVVAAYGRDYAFNRSSFGQQYDAVKWYTALAVHAFGQAVLAATERATPRIKRAAERVREAFRSRISSFRKFRKDDDDAVAKAE